MLAVLEVEIILRCYFEDIIRVDFYGFVLLFINEFIKFLKEVKLFVKIRVCDMLGFGLFISGIVLLRSVL